MKEVAQKLLDKAVRAIRASERLLESEDTEFSAGRAYYAMFYVAEALLSEEGLRFKKHGGVHAAFGEQFSKTRLLDPKYHRWLLEAFNKRIGGDYSVEMPLTSEDVVTMIAWAQEFLQAARQYLGSQP